MELLIWLWTFDNRLLCGLKYGIHSFKYVWLLPVISSMIVLGMVYVEQIKEYNRNDEDDQACLMIVDADLQKNTD